MTASSIKDPPNGSFGQYQASNIQHQVSSIKTMEHLESKKQTGFISALKKLIQSLQGKLEPQPVTKISFGSESKQGEPIQNEKKKKD